MKDIDKSFIANTFASIVELICGITVVIPALIILWIVVSLLFSY